MANRKSKRRRRAESNDEAASSAIKAGSKSGSGVREAPTAETPPRRLRSWLIPMTAIGLVVALLWFWFGLRPQRTLQQATEDIEARQFDQALAHLQQYPAWGSEHSKTRFLKARALRLQGDPTRSLELLDAAKADGFDPERIELERTLVAIQNGQALARFDDLDPLLESAPEEDWATVVESFVIGCITAGEQAPAQQILNAWNERTPNDARVHYWKGVASDLQQDTADSVVHYTAAAQCNPNMVEALMRLSERLVELERVESALGCINLVLKKSPDRVDARLQAAELLWNLGRKEESVAHWRSILRKHPANFPAGYRLGKFYMANQDEKAIVEFLPPVLEAFPNDVNLNAFLGFAYHRLGREDLAKSCLDRVVSSNQRLDVLRYETQDLEKLRDYDRVIEVADEYHRLDWHNSLPLLLWATQLDPYRHDAYERLKRYRTEEGAFGEAKRQERLAAQLINRSTPD